MNSSYKMFSFNEVLRQRKILSLFVHSFLFIILRLLRLLLKFSPYSNGRTVIISLHRLGDTVFTIPAIKAIQRQIQENIFIVCYPESVPIYKLALSNVDFFVVDHNDFYFRERIANSNARNRVKSLMPEIIFDITCSMKSASLILTLRAKKIVGTNGRQFRSIYDHFVEFRTKPKLLDVYLDTISSVISIENRESLIEKNYSIRPDGKILIHPSAGWKEKEWSLRNFIELAEILSAEYQVVIINQIGFFSVDLLEELKRMNLQIIQTESVEELIANIKECSLFIGNDSGPVNIANFIGKPTFTIFGSTNPDFTITSNKHQNYIQSILKCSPVQNEKFCVFGDGVLNCPGVQCMNLLTVDEVLKRIIQLIKKYCSRN